MRSTVRSTRSRIVLAITLALLLMFVFAGTALAGPPANGGLGRSFGQHHAECARMGMLGPDMNPGMHQGFAGWHGGVCEH
jgi:hypothetical protein